MKALVGKIVTRLGAIALVAACPACAADLGGGAGAEMPTGHLVGYGRLAGSTRVLGQQINSTGLLVGAHIESRAEAEQGSRFQGGFMAGYGDGPDPNGGFPVGFEAYAETGTPLGSSLWKRGDLYVGPALAFPIRAYSVSDIRELNNSTTVLQRRLEVVPAVRLREYLDHFDGERREWRTELIFCVALRYRAISDLF